MEPNMPVIDRRRFVARTGTALAGTVAAPAVARAATQRWRMVTSWPKRLPGPGMSAERIAERIAVLSGGRLQVTVHAAGELVPAFEVLDAVGGGVAEMGHTAAFYWQGKQPAAAFYTTVPFGLTPLEHVSWVEHGGGQALWDELYAPFGVKPFMAGNTGVCMGGWFRREVKSLDDLKGLKLRSLGLGGEVFRRLGATPVSGPAGRAFCGAAIRCRGRRRVHHARFGHCARPVACRAELRISRLQQTERHRRMHRRASRVGEA